MGMDKKRLVEYFAQVDERLTHPAELLMDQSDVRYLVSQMKVSHAEVAGAVARLPPGFRNDALVRENLGNLKEDMRLWTAGT